MLKIEANYAIYMGGTCFQCEESINVGVWFVD